MNGETFLKNMDNYIEGLLSANEVIEFESILKNDPNMLSEFNLHKKTRNAIVVNARREKLAELQKIKEDSKDIISQTKTRPLFLKYLPFSIAASMLIVASIWLLNKNNKSSLIDTRIVSVDIKPEAGKLGAAPSRNVTVNIFCCVDSVYLTKSNTEWSLYLDKTYSDADIDRLINSL